MVTYEGAGHDRGGGSVTLRPTAVAFDVVETLFSLAPVEELLEPLGVAADLFFRDLLRDGISLAAAGDFQPFPVVARETVMARAPHASTADLEAVLSAFGRLPAHADAKPAIARLATSGVTVLALTNGSAGTTVSLLESNGLDSYVARVLSVEAVGRWKPSPEPYRHAAATLGLSPRHLALVSVHAWDVHGAHRAGLLTGWCSRLEGKYSGLFEQPDVSAADLVGVADALLELPQ